MLVTVFTSKFPIPDLNFFQGHVCPLSFDHKPNRRDELKRIESGGGWVEFNRVNGALAMSRALGDFFFKQNIDRQGYKESSS